MRCNDLNGKEDRNELIKALPSAKTSIIRFSTNAGAYLYWLNDFERYRVGAKHKRLQQHQNARRASDSIELFSFHYRIRSTL